MATQSANATSALRKGRLAALSYGAVSRDSASNSARGAALAMTAAGCSNRRLYVTAKQADLNSSRTIPLWV